MKQREHSAMGAWPSDLELDSDHGPAMPLSEGRTDDLLEAALERGFSPVQSAPVIQLTPVQAHVQSGKAGEKRSRGRVWLQLAAALALGVLTVGSASAALWWWAPRGREEAPAPRAQAAEPIREQLGAPAVVHVEPKVAPVEPTVVIRPPRKVPVGPRAAEDWLDEGNRLRANAHWREAYEAYARVWKGSPKSGAAYVARIAGASLRLEHFADPRGALANYRAALEHAGEGALDEEARFGVAEAERKLGHVTAERAALQAFLSMHPQAAQAARARTRLAELMRAEAVP